MMSWTNDVKQIKQKSQTILKLDVMLHCRFQEMVCGPETGSKSYWSLFSLRCWEELTNTGEFLFPTLFVVFFMPAFIEIIGLKPSFLEKEESY